MDQRAGLDSALGGASPWRPVDGPAVKRAFVGVAIAFGIFAAPTLAFAAPDAPGAATTLDAAVAPAPPNLVVTPSPAVIGAAAPLDLPRLPLAIAGATIIISGVIEGRR